MGFSEDLNKFVGFTREQGGAVMRKIALEVFVGVVRRTPVDTGRARGSWNLDINQVNKGTGEFDPAAAIGAPPSPARMGQVVAKLATVGWGDEIYISNNLPYIKPLEDGHSKQAPGPGAMVAATVQEATDTLRDIVQRLDT